MSMRVAAALIAFFVASSAQSAERIDRKELLSSIFSAEAQLPDEIFTRGQRRSVSPARLLKQVRAIREDLGEVLQVTGSNGSYSAWTREKRIPVQLQMRADGKISRLRIQKSRKFPLDLNGALKSLQKLPGWVSVLVQKDGKDLFEQNSVEQLSVGSAFRLSVLAALQSRIEAGGVRWSTVVVIKDQHRELGSPVLNRLPVGTAVTLQTLAALMMSFDDHAATDALFEFVGRDAVSAQMANGPVVSAAEHAKLKADAVRADAYGSADEKGKLAVLNALANVASPPAYSAILPADRKIDWLISSRRLCDMMQRVKGLSVFGANHGLSVPEDWKLSALNAGGSAATRSWTIWLENQQAEKFCVSLTWYRGEGVDDAALTQLMVPLIRALNQPEPEQEQAAASSDTVSQ